MARTTTLLSLFMALGLAACGPLYETQYSFIPPNTPQGAMCVGQSQMVEQMCHQRCDMVEDHCRDEENREAERMYHRYLEDCARDRKKPEHGLEYFRHYHSCHEIRCNDICNEDFRFNFSNCGGQVIAQQVCIAFCDKAPAAPQPMPPIMYSAPPPPPPPQIMHNTPAPPPTPHVAAPPPQAPPQAPPQPASLCHIDAHIEVLWKNEWYPAKVKAPARPDGSCPIHYYGYDETYDETVTANRLRLPPE